MIKWRAQQIEKIFFISTRDLQIQENKAGPDICPGFGTGAATGGHKRGKKRSKEHRKAEKEWKKCKKQRVTPPVNQFFSSGRSLRAFGRTQKQKAAFCFCGCDFSQGPEAKPKKMPKQEGKEEKQQEDTAAHHVSRNFSRPKHVRYHWNFSICLFNMSSTISCIFSSIEDPQDVLEIVLFQACCFLYRRPKIQKASVRFVSIRLWAGPKTKSKLPFCFLWGRKDRFSAKTKTKVAFCFCKENS